MSSLPARAGCSPGTVFDDAEDVLVDARKWQGGSTQRAHQLGFLGQSARLFQCQSRSISPENFTGEKGKAGMSVDGPSKQAARELGQGWESLAVGRDQRQIHVHRGGDQWLGARSTDLDDPGPAGPDAFVHSAVLFGTTRRSPPSRPRCAISSPADGASTARINSLPVCVNPGSAFNCYWTMPFHKKARITLEKLDDRDMVLYYQVNYTLTACPTMPRIFMPSSAASRSAAKSVYTILDGSPAAGITWDVPGVGSRSPGWWGEGESSSISTATSSSPPSAARAPKTTFCGSYNFENQQTHRYRPSARRIVGWRRCCPEANLPARPTLWVVRWHIADPIRFEKDLKVTIQALGWQSGGRYLPLEDDIARWRIGIRPSRTPSSRRCQRRPI